MTATDQKYRGTINASSARSPHAQARHCQGVAHEQMRALTTKVRGGVQVLFGRAVAEVLFENVERAQDGFIDAGAYFEEALAEVSERLSSEIDRNLKARGVLMDAAHELHRRYTRGKKPMPFVFAEVIEIAGEQWPYLYAPSDERHVHDFDAAGACRNPACRQLSTEELEPF